MRLLAKAVACAAISLITMAAESSKSQAEEGYELAIVAPAAAGGPTTFRINIATGQVSIVSASPVSIINDPQSIPAGEYRLYLTEAPDNKLFWLYRLETRTGRTWFYTNNAWSEIK